MLIALSCTLYFIVVDGDELFLFGGQLLEELEDGSMQYPLTNNITAAYFVPFESPPGADACTAIVGDTNQVAYETCARSCSA